MILDGANAFWGSFQFCLPIPHANRCAYQHNHTVPYGTALLGWRCPRHFVPGYDQAVPLGRNYLRTEVPGEHRSPGFSP